MELRTVAVGISCRRLVAHELAAALAYFLQQVQMYSHCGHSMKHSMKKRAQNEQTFIIEGREKVWSQGFLASSLVGFTVFTEVISWTVFLNDAKKRRYGVILFPSTHPHLLTCVDALHQALFHLMSFFYPGSALFLSRTGDPSVHGCSYQLCFWDDFGFIYHPLTSILYVIMLVCFCDSCVESGSGERQTRYVLRLDLDLSVSTGNFYQLLR